MSRAVKTARVGLKDPRRPIGSFLFLGPTGVGKTELAKALADFLFGDEEATVSLDMSEYQQEHTEGTAFTFTVLTPDGSECLGCVYVNPTDRFIPPDDLVGSVEGLPEGTAVVGFWVRRSRRDGDLEGRLLESLVGWLRESWDFPAVLVSVAVADTRQRDVVESAGLAERLRVGAVGRAGEWVLYGS